MDLKLQDKVAIVTGASRGIGRAIAISLAQEGCHLTITARDEGVLAQTADVVRGYGRQAAVVAADLREGSERLVVDRTIESYGRLDIVVNCAGATKRGDFFTLSDSDFMDGFALKFFGYVWPAPGSVDSMNQFSFIGFGLHTAFQERPWLLRHYSMEAMGITHAVMEACLRRLCMPIAQARSEAALMVRQANEKHGNPLPIA